MTRESDRRRREGVPEDVDGRPSRLPSFVGPCAREWQAAVESLPRYASVPGLAGLEPDRVVALLAGSAVPRRSEAGTLDAALGTGAARYFPPVRSASLVEQPVPPQGAAPKRSDEDVIDAWLRRPRKAAVKSRSPAIALAPNE